MRLSREEARAALSQVDPGRLRSGLPVGLRDGALLALMAAGLSAVEIERLKASAVTLAGGRLVVSVRREGVPWSVVLPIELGARLLAWLTERRLWGLREPVFRGPQGAFTSDAVRKVLDRYDKALRRRKQNPGSAG
jgi:site-specific recombinase XerC